MSPLLHSQRQPHRAKKLECLIFIVSSTFLSVLEKYILCILQILKSKYLMNVEVFFDKNIISTKGQYIGIVLHMERDVCTNLHDP